jgi:hypothetical protein
MVKFENEIMFSNIQLQIISEEKLLYMCDINGFKLTLSHFASVFKQIFSLSSATFRYHDESTKSYLTLFSILTSNLVSLELHCLHEKLDYYVKSDDIIIRLFMLEESLRGFEELQQVQELIRRSAPTPSREAVAYSEGASKAGKSRLNVQVSMLEIELMEGEE